MDRNPTVAGELARIASGRGVNDLPRIHEDGTVTNTGAVKMCNRCNRRHGSKEGCRMFLRTVVLPDGTTTKRWCT